MTMDITKIIGLTAAVLSSLTFLPQVIKTWKSKSAADISLVMFSVATISVILWLTYGILIGDLPIIIANTVTLAFSATMLLLKLRFGRRK
jgi:MtN3 and saliva related transmembrane protein